mmetsp:Transcript_22493/g.64686  ORF Transcript_22493/g.64686 Transcript_22493/m.64686 type:complete len:267 (-) Transcript_22493:316-1116(-)
MLVPKNCILGVLIGLTIGRSIPIVDARPILHGVAIISASSALHNLFPFCSSNIVYEESRGRIRIRIKSNAKGISQPVGKYFLALCRSIGCLSFSISASNRIWVSLIWCKGVLSRYVSLIGQANNSSKQIILGLAVKHSDIIFPHPCSAITQRNIEQAILAKGAISPVVVVYRLPRRFQKYLLTRLDNFLGVGVQHKTTEAVDRSSIQTTLVLSVVAIVVFVIIVMHVNVRYGGVRGMECDPTKTALSVGAHSGGQVHCQSGLDGRR